MPKKKQQNDERENINSDSIQSDSIKRDSTKSASPSSLSLAQIGRLEEQLRRAIIAGRTARVRTLLQNHPWLIETTFEYEDIHQTYSPLHLAAIYGKYALIKLLLKSGADVLARTRSGRLPLYYAASYTPPPLYHAAKMTRALLEAMQTAISGEWEQAAILVETMAQLLADPEKGSFSMLVLDAANANLDAHDAKGRSALHHAVTAGNIDAFDMLHELGAEPDPADHAGNTPLHLAVWAGSTVMVAIALKQECEPLHQNDDGVSPYTAAIQSQSVVMLGLFHRHRDVQQQIVQQQMEGNTDNENEGGEARDENSGAGVGEELGDSLEAEVRKELREHYRAQWQARRRDGISDIERLEELPDSSSEWFWDEDEEAE